MKKTRLLNGFIERCCVYEGALVVLTEMKLSNKKGEYSLDCLS